MSAFIYFAEGVQSIKLSDLQEWGIDYAFDGMPSYHGETVAPRSESGPSGAGYIFADDYRIAPKLPKILHEEQIWRKFSEARRQADVVGRLLY